ncbi:MAG TPA: type 4a pilus biogenesis protein PilO [Nitrospirota bacterium]|nr:type 4a pilus biogenesis protein PilO [Nitrospirota bacterium]
MAAAKLFAAFRLDKLSRRERVLMMATAAALVSALIYLAPFRALEHATAQERLRLAAAERTVPELSLQLADLKARAEEIKAGAKGWSLVDRKGVILVLEDVSNEARKQGVNILSVHPTQEVEKESHREVALNIDLKGRYRELAAYFKHLENQSRLVSIRKIRVEACPDSSSSCATQLEAVTYLEK